MPVRPLLPASAILSIVLAGFFEFASAGLFDPDCKPATLAGTGEQKTVSGVQLMQCSALGATEYAANNLTSDKKCYRISGYGADTGWQPLPPRSEKRKFTLGKRTISITSAAHNPYLPGWARSAAVSPDRISFEAKDYPETGDCNSAVSEPALTQAQPPAPARPPPSSLDKGWHGLDWGTSLGEFQARFPKSAMEPPDYWVTGEGIEELAGLWMTAQYAFNKHDRLYAIRFAPRKEDQMRVVDVFSMHYGKPAIQGSVSTWKFDSGNVEINIALDGALILLIHKPLSED